MTEQLVLSDRQRTVLEFLCISGRAPLHLVLADNRIECLDGLERLGLVRTTQAGSLPVMYHLNPAGRELLFVESDDLDDLSEEATDGASSEGSPDATLNPNLSRKENSMTSTTATTPRRPRGKKADPATTEVPPVVEASEVTTPDDLFKTLQARIKEAAGSKVSVTKKAVYLRFNLGRPTIVYLNLPGKKTVRVEVPKAEGTGYDAVGVKDQATMDAALALVAARIELVSATA